MEDGTQTIQTDTQGTQANPTPETTDKPLSIVDEARAIRDEIRTEREKLEKANSEAKSIAAENLLGGNTGGNVVATPAKEETPKEYRARIDKEMAEGKHND